MTLDDVDLIDPDPGNGQEQKAKSTKGAQAKALRDLTQRWGQKHVKRVDELARDLGTSVEASERLIHRLAATSTAISEMLGRAQLQLAERLERFVDEPKALLVVAKSLREVTGTQNSTLRSVQELLSAAATLRAQRRLVDSHEKRMWHEDVGGASLGHARRDPSTRAPASN